MLKTFLIITMIPTQRMTIALQLDRVAKLVPNMKLKKIFNLEEKALKEALRSDEFARVAQLKSIANHTLCHDIDSLSNWGFNRHRQT